MSPLEVAARGAALYPANMNLGRRSTVCSTTGGNGAGMYHLHYKNGGNGSCTHLTCTRIFTQDFRCAVCIRPGSLGWIYRCTQDRDLLLENDIEMGVEDKLDNLCDLFKGMAQTPRKRSATARMHPSSVLTEINENELKDYSGEQLYKILCQRSHLLDVLAHADHTDPNFFPGVSSDAFQPNTKPWLPLRDGECQFKVCHTCRPNFQERSFLSLNGIVNDDIPPTAITGFGFHLIKKRPVSLVKHVRNLGLRPNPSPSARRPDPTTPPRALPPRPKISPNSKPHGNFKRRPASVGLGISPAEQQHKAAARPVTPAVVGSQQGQMLPPTSTTPLLSVQASAVPSAVPSRSRLPVRGHTPPSTRIPVPVRVACLDATRRHSLATSTVPNPNPTTSIDVGMDVVPAPRTPMEQNEQFGDFGSEPLDLMDGVAVTEEGVELHVADVIMQY